MDRVIEKKKGIQKKHLPYILGGGLLLAFLVWLIFGNHQASLRIDSRSIIVGEAKQDQFNDFVRVNGQVQPITTIQLAPLEGGVVEQKVVEEGATVRRGDVIVRLSNSQLNLQILESEASLAEKENFLRNTLVTMEQEKLTLQQNRLQLNLDVERKERKYRQNERLFQEKMIAKEDYLQAKEDWELAVRSRELVMERQKQDSIYRSIQVENMEESLESMRRSMRLIRERVENLNVKSPIDGQLGSLDVVLGQSVMSGAKIGQINDLSAYKIEANIDEHYIDRVRQDLDATFERQSSVFDLVVSKVYPEVRNGQFKTDFCFSGEKPDNIRTGQTYYINLELGQPTRAVIIPRGAFYQKTGGTWIYVLSTEGDKAQKRSIRIGRQNPQYYEVLEGLEPGEKVIVSSYENYGDNEILILD
ncbi:MAG TPA: HlyD family efflux transporter periplasmic adaptor subunit [Bacteroidales bacterium]|nr:HlyD family efflux transporter periplasmic adaptor subunit [Bacteroidales bacterium]